jgi:PLP dependent protein
MAIAERLEQVRSEIDDAARGAGRAPDSIELIAVSKTHPANVIREAVEAGQLVFGESKVQEAKSKISELPSKLHWHMIGHLQSNKVRQALPLFEWFHGVDSLELLQEMNRIAGEEGLFPKILLQVNVAGESSKFGFSPEILMRQMEEVLGLDRLQIEGLMTIPPLAPDPEHSRRYYAELGELRDKIQGDLAFSLPHLSMGMSNDYQVAIEEGATMVRVGSAIFGERKSKKDS